MESRHCLAADIASLFSWKFITGKLPHGRCSSTFHRIVLSIFVAIKLILHVHQETDIRKLGIRKYTSGHGPHRIVSRRLPFLIISNKLTTLPIPSYSIYNRQSPNSEILSNHHRPSVRFDHGDVTEQFKNAITQRSPQKTRKTTTSPCELSSPEQSKPLISYSIERCRQNANT
jgi:hypothetical protein